MADKNQRLDPVEPLKGGNTAESVLRVGRTVRKPATISTPAVQSFVTHLRSVGFQAAPRPLGVDEGGRQVWEYIPGELWHSIPERNDFELHQVGKLIRDLHDAAASFGIPEDARWNQRYQFHEQELICHNDLAPWNLVCAEEGRRVFIDWDAAAPGTRLWDLAWSCIAFPPFEPDCDLVRAATAMQNLCHGYGLASSHNGELIRLMFTRAREEYGLIVEGARRGEVPWTTLHRDGHHLYWGPVADYIERNAATLKLILQSVGAG